MILLLGGTSETAPLAADLVQAGFSVLVSTATDIPLALDDHPRLRRRSGPLDASGLEELMQNNSIRVLVDATHPYATAISVMAAATARQANIPYLAFVRPGIATGGVREINLKAAPEEDPAVEITSGPLSGVAARMASEIDRITFAADHNEAARLACTGGKPVLLTTGSRNLRPYAEEARRTGVPLIVRVLPHPESLAACRTAGIPAEMIIAAKGPFSVSDNRAAIHKFKIGVLVTKDSGEAGGVPAKIAAAQAAGCRLIIVRRPSVRSDLAFNIIEDIVNYLSRNRFTMGI